MSQQMQPIQLAPMAAFGNTVVAVQALLGVDFNGYTAKEDGRAITIYIVGPHEIDLIDADADAFKAWFEQISGQNRIQPAQGPIPNLRST